MKRRRGNIVAYCSCRDAAGKSLHTACPDRDVEDHVRWSYRISVRPGPDGRRRQTRKGGFLTKADAEEAMNVASGLVSTGTYSVTVGEYLTAWLADADIRETTVQSYDGCLRRHLLPRLGHLRLHALTQRDVSEMYDSMRSQGSSIPTIRTTHAVLSSALVAAVNRQVLTRNPVQYIVMPAAPKFTPSLWSPEQTAEFLDYLQANNERHLALYRILALRGLRRGEVVGLRWQDLDLDGQTARIAQAVATVGHRLIVGPPKTAASVRSVSLDAGTVAALRTLQVRTEQEKLMWGRAMIDSGRVFTDKDGRSLHPNTVSLAFGRLVTQSGLPQIRLQDLRHGAATLAMEAGVPLPVAAAQLGHASILTTADYYTHTRPAVAQAAAEMIASYVTSRAPAPCLADPHVDAVG